MRSGVGQPLHHAGCQERRGTGCELEMLRRCDIADLQPEVCMLRLGISGVQNLRKERRAHSVPVHFSVYAHHHTIARAGRGPWLF